MKRDAAEILRDALLLPPEGRAAVAGSLIESLDEAVDPDSEQAWQIEVVRRLREIDTGAVGLVSWSEVKQRLRGTR
ncbi:MAG: addiction module protein [Candidatus Riflebacteria bacterium]|nr:addiction module protein [Candidatus Riflebacteria bacterium]